ncbi:MAG: hypothetical protein FJ104_00425 [Deltaproteobacteria bacterium]|nr:hypothetical protein [Deltaproteobacteria bacterium]
MLVHETRAEGGRISVGLLRPDGARQFEDTIPVGTLDARPGVKSGAVVALPDGDYAVAWATFDIDGAGSGIALARVTQDGQVTEPRLVNVTTAGSQQDVDLAFAGGELVVSYSDGETINGPAARYRRFGLDLEPTSGELRLGSDLPDVVRVDGQVVPFGGGFAVAFSERRRDFSVRLVVEAGDARFESAVEPFVQAHSALVALDAARLAFVYARSSTEDAFGDSRVRLALLDVGAPGPLVGVAVPEVGDAAGGARGQDDPRLVMHDGRLVLGWGANALPSDGLTALFAVKEVPLVGATDGGLALDLSLPERRLLPAWAIGGLAGTFHLASTPHGAPRALLAAVQDSGYPALWDGMRRPDVATTQFTLPLAAPAGGDAGVTDASP